MNSVKFDDELEAYKAFIRRQGVVRGLELIGEALNDLYKVAIEEFERMNNGIFKEDEK